VGTGINMAKAKMKQAVIPKFSSEAEEAAWWDAHRSEIEAEIRQRMKQKQPLTLDNLFRGARPSQPVTLRIPQDDLETARRLAARKGLGYQTYIKMLLRDALAENAGDKLYAEECPSRTQNASIPVTLAPMISVWISCVPSYVFTDSRFIRWRMIG
jgi:predicted DNA binding CopG/RHH family protein